MLKLKIKISLYSLLHVSVLPDHPQGAYAEPCQTYTFVKLISKNTSLKCCSVVATRVSVCAVFSECRIAARHSEHTAQPETHVASTLQHPNDVFLLINSTKV
jgi:hypothetical protein